MGERVVVVTGSSGAIGAAILQRFDALGDVTVGLDLSEGFDVADPGALEAAAGRVLAEFGRVDVLCNNAGVGVMAADEVAHGIRVNCVSPGTVASPWVERLVEATADPEATYETLRQRQPLGRLVTCDEVAGAVAYLADAECFTTGADVLLDGGISGVRLVE
jgi:NAD(P)-dependent dehydrogenase (short-subunit alcohol dehydrogenase family)